MVTLEVSARPFLVHQKATRSGQRGNEVDIAAARAGPAEDDVVGQHRPQLRLGAGAGVEDAGDDGQRKICTPGRFSHRALRENLNTQRAKRWLTSLCNAPRFGLWQEMSGLCRNSKQINSISGFWTRSPC